MDVVPRGDGSGTFGDEITRDDTSGSLENPEESNRKEASSTIDQANIDAVSQPKSSAAEIEAENYLEGRKIYELIRFLMGHLLVDEPDEPIGYLHDLLDKCMLFRAGLAEPPLFFDTRHINNIFHSLDPSGSDNISLESYKTGMETLGIESYDREPRETIPGRVDKNTFTKEAKRCLTRMLSEMIGESN